MSRSISSRHAGAGSHVSSNAAAAAAAYNAAYDADKVILCTGSYDNTIKFWKPREGECIRTIQHADSQVNKLAISGDKQFLAAAGYQSIRIYNIHEIYVPYTANNNTTEIKKIDAHSQNVTTVSWFKDCQRLLSASEDSTIKIWDYRKTDVPQANVDIVYSVNDCIINPRDNETTIVSADQAGKLKLWDLRSLKEPKYDFMPDEEGFALRSVTMAPESKHIVVGNNKGSVFVYPYENGIVSPTPFKFKAHDRYLLRCLLSLDGKTLATSSADGLIKLWDMEKIPKNPTNDQPQQPNQPVVEQQSSLDIPLPPPSSSSSLTTSFEPSKILSGHSRWVWDITFSADSAYLISASSDHTARLWELTNGKSVSVYSGHERACICVALNDINM